MNVPYDLNAVPVDVIPDDGTDVADNNFDFDAPIGPKQWFWMGQDKSTPTRKWFLFGTLICVALYLTWRNR